ncbi:MarR family winged helix-turn-helix transcriptional regulator [Microbacterium sp. NPDC091313]
MTGSRPERRLLDEEMTVWLPLIRLVQLLPQALDRTLRDETGINHAHYAILVSLAQGDDAPPTMSELARIAALSPSRLSHAIDALERRGWVQRRACDTDRRAQRPVLTGAGRDALRSAAPAHVAQIRALVLDRLDPAQRAQLAEIAGILASSVEDSLRA